MVSLHLETPSKGISTGSPKRLHSLSFVGTRREKEMVRRLRVRVIVKIVYVGGPLQYYGCKPYTNEIPLSRTLKVFILIDGTK